MASAWRCGRALRRMPSTRMPSRLAAFAAAPPMSPRPNDQHRLAGDARREDRRPPCLLLVAHHFRQPSAQRQQRHGGEFAGLLDVHAAVVGERHLLRQPVERQQRLDAGADDVDPAQLRRRLGQRLLGEGPVGDDVVAGDQAFGGGEPAEILEVLADRPAHGAAEPGALVQPPARAAASCGTRSACRRGSRNGYASSMVRRPRVADLGLGDHAAERGVVRPAQPRDGMEAVDRDTVAGQQRPRRRGRPGPRRSAARSSARPARAGARCGIPWRSASRPGGAAPRAGWARFPARAPRPRCRPTRIPPNWHASTHSVASVATLTTNWPVAAMLAAVSFSVSPRRPIFTASIGGRLQTKV